MNLLRNNPVWEKEVRSRFRIRKQTRASLIASIVAGALLVVLLYYATYSSLLDQSGGKPQLNHSSAQSVFSLLTMGLEASLFIFVAPSLAAGTITRERERQTWNALLLSRLGHGEIVAGKFAAALVPLLLTFVVLLPLNLFCAYVGKLGASRVLLIHVILLCTLLFFTGVSLFCSWICRRTYLATAASFGATAFFTIGNLICYGLFETARYGSSNRVEMFPPMWLNPYLALYTVLDEDLQFGFVGVLYVILTIVLTGLLLWVISRRLALGPKELEQ